jgi:hypothetical protein
VGWGWIKVKGGLSVAAFEPRSEGLGQLGRGSGTKDSPGCAKALGQD